MRHLEQYVIGINVMGFGVIVTSIGVIVSLVQFFDAYKSDPSDKDKRPAVYNAAVALLVFSGLLLFGTSAFILHSYVGSKERISNYNKLGGKKGSGGPQRISNTSYTYGKRAATARKGVLFVNGTFCFGAFVPFAIILSLGILRKSDQPSLKIPVVLCSAASKTVTATCGKLITLSVWSGVQIVLALASLLYCLIVYGGYKDSTEDPHPDIFAKIHKRPPTRKELARNKILIREGIYYKREMVEKDGVSTETGPWRKVYWDDETHQFVDMGSIDPPPPKEEEKKEDPPKSECSCDSGSECHHPRHRGRHHRHWPYQMHDLWPPMFPPMPPRHSYRRDYGPESRGRSRSPSPHRHRYRRHRYY